MKKEYIAPRAAAIRLAMEDTMLTGSKLSTDGSDITTLGGGLKTRPPM